MNRKTIAIGILLATLAAPAAALQMHPVWVGSGTGTFSSNPTFDEDFQCDGDTLVVAVRWPAALSPLRYEMAFSDGPPNAGSNLGCNIPTWDAWTAVAGTPETGFYARINSSDGCTWWEMSLGPVGQDTPFLWRRVGPCDDDPSVTTVSGLVDF